MPKSRVARRDRILRMGIQSRSTAAPVECPKSCRRPAKWDPAPLASRTQPAALDEWRRNRWTDSPGTGGRIQSEQVDGFNRTGWTDWSGIRKSDRRTRLTATMLLASPKVRHGLGLSPAAFAQF